MQLYASEFNYPEKTLVFPTRGSQLNMINVLYATYTALQVSYLKL